MPHLSRSGVSMRQIRIDQRPEDSDDKRNKKIGKDAVILVHWPSDEAFW